MNPLIHYLIAIIVILAGSLAYSIYNVIGYRNLTVKLADNLKSLYCEHIDKDGKSCTFLKYFTTPVDEHKGMITEFCSIHLMEKHESVGD